MRNQLRIAAMAAMLALDSLADGNPQKVVRYAENITWDEALEASRIALMGQETWDSLAA